MEQQGNQLTVEQAMKALQNASDIKNYQVFTLALENTAFAPVEEKKGAHYEELIWGKAERLTAMIIKILFEHDILLAYLKKLLTNEEDLKALKEHAKKSKGIEQWQKKDSRRNK